MPGIINQELAEQPDQSNDAQSATPPETTAAEPVAKSTAPSQPKFRSRVIEAIPEELRDAFQRAVLGGMKIMYDKSMAPEIQQALEAPGPLWKKLPEAVARLVTLIDMQSKKTLPQSLLIPVGIELLHEANSFLDESGRESLSPDDLQKSTLYLAVVIAKIYGVADADIPKLIGQGNETTAEPAQPVEA